MMKNQMSLLQYPAAAANASCAADRRAVDGRRHSARRRYPQGALR
jgi:hypothetical protein